jgi:hypothetical protein
MTQPRKAPAALKRAAQRSAEKALIEERLALAAIVKVFLAEVPEPERALRRIEAMVRSAEANAKTPVATRKMLLDAHRFIATAVERETGRPQTLFDPHVRHLREAEVEAVGDAHPQGEQLGFGNGGLADAEEAHAERVRTVGRVQTILVELLKQGACSDAELWARYIRAGRLSPDQAPAQSLTEIGKRRKELTANGRVLATGERNKLHEPLWGLLESSITTGGKA